jgi:O-antigen biosynthesis protein
MNPQSSSLESQRRMHPDASPTVSVLIRTTGRPTLRESIESVRSQTFGECEIVVLNARGEPIDGLPAWLSGLSARVLVPGGSVGRARAANLLLEAARGELALFLDDDDWLLPDHLAKLVDTLRSQPGVVAAYADVEAVAAARTAQRRTVHVFDSDFDPVALQLHNYLPIHAVLFRVASVRGAPPCRFDESMTLFEDWDFWLQLAAKGPFQRVPGVSAVYAYEPEQGSSHGVAGGERERMLAALGARHLARWQPGDVARLIEYDVQRTNELNESRQRADAIAHHAQELQTGFDAAQRWNTELRDAIERARETQQAQQQELVRGQEQLRASDEQLAHSRKEVAHALEQVAFAREQFALAQAEIAARHAEVARLRATIDEHERAIATGAIASARQQHELQVLAHVREQLLAQIAEIRASTSWRITRPLRGAGRLLRHAAERLRAWRNVLRAVKEQVGRHGVTGFARRLPYYLRHGEAYLARVTGLPAVAMSNPFGASAPPVRDLPLHPDLEQPGEPFDVSVSVVIPTLNAGAEFEWLLRKLRAQRGLRELQIVVVDSGSRDDTIALARAAGAKVVTITPAEFTHSHSRNVGADAADGDYLLFMVQDAFPIGEYWLHGMLRFLRDPAHEKLAAVSCSESSRSDSDLMYDAMIDTHYRFLECREQDRVGRHRGNDHMSLRSQGQLSDVSCLIGRDLFARYRYRGDYAEDLDLGIRLIKDGWQVAMLASVKVVHSHNRPAYYYLKRSFVDVQFLVGLFDDFTYPPCESLPGLVAGIVSGAGHVSGWLAQIHAADAALTGARLREWLPQWRGDLQALRIDAVPALGDARLDDFVRELPTRFPARTDKAATAQARQFSDMLMGRLEHFAQYAAQVYDDADDVPRAELAAVVCKTFAATAGSALSFYCLDRRRDGAPDRQDADAIHRELTAGV